MTDRHEADEELRKAFQSLGDASREELSTADHDDVWRAVSDELPAPERRALVDRMAGDPALGESWRVAWELSRQLPSPARVAAAPVRTWTRGWMAAAAILLLATGAGVIIQQSRPAVEDRFRDSQQYVVEALVPSNSVLPRDAFRLRWTPGPEGVRYQVRVTTEDLEVLTTASELTAPEFVVDSELLSRVPAGSVVFWQVDAMLPEGNTVSSQTFVVKVQ